MCAPISSLTQKQATLTRDGAFFSPEESETKWFSCGWSAILCWRDDDDDRTHPQLRAEQVSKQVSEGRRKCALESV